MEAERAAIDALRTLREVKVTSNLWIGMPMAVPWAIVREEAMAAVRKALVGGTP